MGRRERSLSQEKSHPRSRVVMRASVSEGASEGGGIIDESHIEGFFLHLARQDTVKAGKQASTSTTFKKEDRFRNPIVVPP